MEEFLDKLSACKESETYVIEMIRYYLKNKGSRLANLYYKNHKQLIKSKDGKMKIQSLLQEGHEKDYYNYLIENKELSYGPDIRYVYSNCRDFYGNLYMDELMELIEKNCNEYNLAYILKNIDDNQRLCYYLLKKAGL